LAAFFFLVVTVNPSAERQPTRRLIVSARAVAHGAWPGDLEPGDLEPGDLGPGDLGPGDLEPGDLGPGDLEPGDLGPGDLEPGDLGPATSAHGARTIMVF
jgi:hypothetical protein